MARMATRPTMASSSGGVTLTLQEQAPPSTSSSSAQTPQTLVLRLKCPKKKVTWKEGTVDNEFLNRKSSKKCCIFHKQKSFDEDDSDADDEDGHCGGPGDGGDRKGKDGAAGRSGCCSHGSGEHRRN